MENIPRESRVFAGFYPAVTVPIALGGVTNHNL